jgi:hypothetical protein
MYWCCRDEIAEVESVESRALERSLVKKHMDFGGSLAASALMAGTLVIGPSMLPSSVATAQTPQAKPTASTAAPANSESNSITSAHQDQFGHASGSVANASTQQSANAQEARKHIAGVKYEDRTSSPSNGASTGQLDAKGIQEKSLSSNTSGTATSNAMAIKENGSSSKPSIKPNR